MKKLACFLVLACLLLAATAVSKEAIPARYAPILESWNATTGEELWSNILESWRAEYNEAYPPQHWPLNIRFGGTTKELIVDQKNWDLAIVSSKDVDLQNLADEGLIMSSGYIPSNSLATSQWLFPKQLQNQLPVDPILMYHIYCYAYDAQTNDATLLICQADIGRKKNSPRAPVECAQEILSKRTADQIRAVEGIARVSWTQDELLGRHGEWDVGILSIQGTKDLDALDQAGLLYDFSNDSYWLSRDREWGVPNGIFSADDRLIAIPYMRYWTKETTPFNVFVVNAKGVDISLALAYETHWMKSYEWLYDRAIYGDTPSDLLNKYGISIYKDQVDW